MSYSSLPVYDHDSAYPLSDIKTPHTSGIPLLPQQSGSTGYLAARQGQGQARKPPQWNSLYLQGWFMSGLLLGMVLLAAGTEALLWESERRQGWNFDGLQSFGGFNYLKSAIPVIVTYPITMLWLAIDQLLGRFHPYVMLSKGGVLATESILLDYTSGRSATMFKAFRFGHWVILFSSFICLANLGLSPLASGVLTTKSTLVTYQNVPVNSLKTIGLDDTYVTLEYFVAASGYAFAAAIHNLTDPPFVFKGAWSIAQFALPPAQGQGVNETVLVPTTAIESAANCDPADTINAQGSQGPIGSTFNVTGTWDGCTVPFPVVITGGDQWGVLPVANCVTHPEADPFKPVLFWFYVSQLNQVDLAFCKPTIQLWNVMAEASMTTGLIVDVKLVDQNVAPNNISGPPINGVGLNGIDFDTVANGTDKYIAARALATQTEVPGAIYRSADAYGGPAAVVQSQFGFVNITDNVYTRFLAIAGQSTYFVNTQTQIPSTVESSEIRLWVYPLAAHAFAGALILVAFVGAMVHITHSGERKNVFIGSSSGATIGSVLAMTSSSEFPKLLHADMDDGAMEDALRGMRFGINRRTWQADARVLGQETPYDTRY